MEISSSDTFTVSWTYSYQTEFSFEVKLEIECYANSAISSKRPKIVAMSDLKSYAQIRIKRGDVFVGQDKWQKVVIVGEEHMRWLIRNIMMESLHLDSDDIDDVMESVEEALVEGMITPIADPRLN